VFDEPVETLAGAETASTPAAAVLTVDPRLATQNLLAEAAPASAAVAELPAPASEPGAMPWMAEGHLRMPALLNRTEETEKYQRRLRYLMRCINRDRAPYCPLNGVILLLPFAALANDEDVSQIASVCQADLRVLRESARTRCPVFLLVADLETAPGYPALRECLDLDRRLRLFGQDLPLIPDLKPEELPGMIAGSLRHFTQALTHWIFRLFRVEKSGLEQAAAAIAANGQLFELLGTIRHRAPGLERILTRLITADPPLEFMVGGFYLAATGSNPERDQAFVPGVFQHLVQHQNAVAWTQDALDEEADYRRWTVYGYAALAIFCIAVTVIIYGRWQMLHW
jgi:type VI protein secretion system component VasK